MLGIGRFAHFSQNIATVVDSILLIVVSSPLIFLLVIKPYIVARTRELTKAQKSTEEKDITSKAILNGISDGIVFTDTERRISEVNQGMKKVFGYDRSDLIGKKTVVLYESEDEYERQGRIRFNLSSEAKLEPYEVNYRRKDGGVFVGETLGSSIKGPDGKVLGFVGVMRNITKRKNTEATLKIAKDEAERSSKAKSEFLASMSHELRTPLNAVLGFAQMLQFDSNNPLSSAQNVNVESILEGGDHLLQLVNQVLDLAEIEADQISLSLEKVNASEIVADCVNLIRPLGKPKGITITSRFDDKSLVILRTDPTRLKQVLINLISNAIKYNKHGGIVTVEGRETDDGFLHISVNDTGYGIATEDYSGVFEIFNQLNQNPMIAKEGTGIGLPVSKMLVERMSGRIGFVSEKGTGSTFWIELPLASNRDVLIWADNLRIGVDAFDLDHQTLISIINRISDPSIEESELNDLVGKLVDYTHYHFAREEAVMEVCAYPDFEEHRGLHRELAAKIHELSGVWRKERNAQTLFSLRKFMRDWLINHIMNKDVKIASYTKGKGQDISQALEIIKAARNITSLTEQSINHLDRGKS